MKKTETVMTTSQVNSWFGMDASDLDSFKVAKGEWRREPGDKFRFWEMPGPPRPTGPLNHTPVA
jgi:hypothetical protein